MASLTSKSRPLNSCSSHAHMFSGSLRRSVRPQNYDNHDKGNHRKHAIPNSARRRAFRLHWLVEPNKQATNPLEEDESPHQGDQRAVSPQNNREDHAEHELGPAAQSSSNSFLRRQVVIICKKFSVSLRTTVRRSLYSRKARIFRRPWSYFPFNRVRAKKYPFQK